MDASHPQMWALWRRGRD